ncbi:MAG: ABC transporter ATP-binding protein [Candidatus Zeuxoniibacter abyssi]|nr:MAG: ABC transporter ATP-binding protein [Candidatus Persebacteraceae bacterium AB1(2)]
MNALLSIRHLSKRFGEHTAVADVSLDIYDKEFVALLGPSGCGKTTLLRMLGGFENPDAGEILLEGKDMTGLPPNKRPVNMVFQSYAVFPHMTTFQNIAYGLHMEKIAKDEITKRVDEAMNLVRMSEFALRYPEQLSGGQQQRVALARALVKRPRLLLLDEPLSALDANLREAMQVELVKLQRTVGIAFVVVTHDQDEALSMAEKIAVMEEGAIRQVDTPRALYESPNTRFVADFIGRMNILPMNPITDVHGKTCIDISGLGRMDCADVPQTDAAYIAVRPEKLLLGDWVEAEGFEATVDGLSYYGGQTVLYLRAVGGASLTASWQNKSRRTQPPAVGERLRVKWAREDMIFLSE